ncbi:hypothetical protein NONO_c57030 [Nocardia nova SH22a]|uniref:Shedu protein SduA C-terminal domain-containing protein n=1 Tax=Nocardia nova SH22a TaxID=1415166 RepID=W5TTF8_9NOCA|nr:Shedu immune nuclease family protein [Nocardia nova]AHH20481.1 hypothetical protein NONO_c57030 [Nocardia nova SH22a]
MARIKDLRPNTQNIRPHKLENGVSCEHQVIPDSDGQPLLHLSTFGSANRQLDPKSSQSLQVDSQIATELVGIIRSAFGDESLNIQPRVDIAFSPEIAIAPTLLAQAYQKNPDAFRQLVSDDDARGDIVAMAHRRKQVARFRRLLEDDGYFESEKMRLRKGGPEAVWQDFFEHNPWIFGVALAGQFLTSWDHQKLEQVVSGDSVSSTGKRVDALLRTSGRIKSMVFAEIKTHKKPLLKPTKDAYRPGCWAPSDELSGGVVQVQGTVHRAVSEMAERLQDTASDGSDIPGEFTYLLRPRAYLIIGRLDSLRGEQGGDHQDKFRSFELFRRALIEPEILTFDEVLARAEWAVESLLPDGDAGTDADDPAQNRT